MIMFNIFNIKINFIMDFLKILLFLYYKNNNIYSELIFITCKFILLFKYLILTKYYKFNKNFLLKKQFLLFISKINNKILNIKITSKTTKSTIIRKFCIISIIGNQTNWIGVGVAKHKKLAVAVRNSYINAFKNIIYFYKKLYILKNFKLKYKTTQLIIHNFHSLNNNSVMLNTIFTLLGFGIKSKIVGVSSNINNLLYIIKNLSHINLY